MKKLTPEEQKMKEEGLRHFVRQPFEEKADFYLSTLRKVKHVQIRDFIVSEPVFDKDKMSAVIFHIPSGQWHGLIGMSFEETKQTVELHPEQDDNLVRVIFGLPPIE